MKRSKLTHELRYTFKALQSVFHYIQGRILRLSGHQTKVIPDMEPLCKISFVFFAINKQGIVVFSLYCLFFRKMVNTICTEKRQYVCSTPSLDQPFVKPCPLGYISYKKKCYYSSPQEAAFTDAQALCAERGGQLLNLHDQASYQFIRAYSNYYSLSDLLLGLNLSTNITMTPALYVDGTSFNKTINYAYDDQSVRFGQGPCVILKQGVIYWPRDTDCTTPYGVMCVWQRKYTS